jgi:hypothetical protein
MAPAPNLQDLIDTVRRDTVSGDPLDLLTTASTTAADLSTAGDALLDHYVLHARQTGRSWAEISAVLGVTKQAAHKRFGPGTIPNDMARFTDRARAVLAEASAAARGLGHDYVGTEHFLLGILADPRSLAAKVLINAEITQDRVREAVLDNVPPRDTTPAGHIPHTPQTRSFLTATLAEALEHGHNYVGTEHMLLGLYGAPEGLAAQLLLRFGLDRETARARVLEALAQFLESQERKAP